MSSAVYDVPRIIVLPYQLYCSHYTVDIMLFIVNKSYNKCVCVTYVPVYIHIHHVVVYAYC